MLKKFYKKKIPTKFFYDSKMQVRSRAYGKEIHEDFIKWEEYFLALTKNQRLKIRLSDQGDIRGRGFMPDGAWTGSDDPIGDRSHLPMLVFNSITYEADINGNVIINGAVSPYNIGSELKAWAIATVPFGRETKNSLFVIGKPMADGDMRLTAYELTANGLNGKTVTSVSVESTLSQSSYMTCFGRHIFTIHNSRLTYYYYDIEECSIDKVAVGDVGDPETEKKLRYVEYEIVADKEGCIFWMSENTVFGISVGYPKRLIKIDGPPHEKLIGLRAESEGISVIRRDINTGKEYRHVYVKRSDGLYIKKSDTV